MKKRSFKFNNGRGAVLCSRCSKMVCTGLRPDDSETAADRVFCPEAVKLPDGRVFCRPEHLPEGAAGSPVFEDDGYREVTANDRPYAALCALKLVEPRKGLDGAGRVLAWVRLCVDALAGLELGFEDYRAVFAALARRDDLRDAVLSTAALDQENARERVLQLLRAHLGHLWDRTEAFLRCRPLGGGP